MSGYRELFLPERQLVARLLESDFPGRDEIIEQMKEVKVRPADDDGCLEFLVSDKSEAPVLHRVPVEAEAEDEDGVGIHALLHVASGKVKELEFYKDDGTPIKRMPDASEWRILALPPPPS